MQATGMDSLHAFPYVRAALIGHATRDRRTGNRVTRRGSACSQLFQDCPSNSDSLLDYFNNHNGGIFNQVQPSVDNEVAPIVQAILADVVGGGGTSSTGPQTAASTAGEGSFLDSGLFQAGDSLFTVCTYTYYLQYPISNLYSLIRKKNDILMCHLTVQRYAITLFKPIILRTRLQ